METDRTPEEGYFMGEMLAPEVYDPLSGLPFIGFMISEEFELEQKKRADASASKDSN